MHAGMEDGILYSHKRKTPADTFRADDVIRVTMTDQLCIEHQYLIVDQSEQLVGTPEWQPFAKQRRRYYNQNGPNE